jgi:glycosyltransferase 2 family protein
MPDRRRTLRWLLRLAVTTGIVAYLLSILNLRDVLSTFRGVRAMPFAAVVGLYLAGQTLSAFKWALLGRAVGFAEPLGDYVRFYFIGMFFNLFGPSTIGGDVVRALYLSQGRQRGLAFNSVVFDRVTGLVVLAALAALALAAFPRWRFPWPLTTAVMVVGIVLVLGWWTCPRLVRILPEGNALRRHVEQDLAPFWRDRGLLLRVVAASALFHLSQVCAQWVLARAVGTTIPFSYCLTFHPVLAILTALSLTLGGFGIREGGYVYFLRRVGIAAPVAVTMGLLGFAVILIGGLVGGLFFVASGARLPRLRPGTSSPADLPAA